MKKKANKNVNYDKIKGFLKIPSTSEPYLKAKYLMELHLGTFELETFNIWRVENQALRTLYEDYCEQDTVTKVNTVMLVQNLGELNSPLQISERGFLIPQSGGLLFPCGFLPSDLDSAKVYNAIICEIAVASPIEETAQNITPEFIAKVEKGTDYDSIKIKPKENEKAAIMKTHPFENNMILFSSDQIMPKFVVEFSYKQNTKGLCGVCKNEESSIYCHNDELDFCTKCDSKHHSATSKVTSKHKRVNISQKPVIYHKCETHPNQDIELICSDCQEQICITCKLSGSHSKPPLNSHSIVSIQDCYDFLKQTKSKKSVQMKNISNKIQGFLNNLKYKIDKMNNDFREMGMKIDAAYEKAKKELKETKEKEMKDVQSLAIMLEQKLKELNWMEYFTKFQIDYQNPGEYIDKFFTHQKMQQQFYNSVCFPNERISSKHSEYMVNIGFEIVNLAEILAEKERQDREREIEQKAKVLHEIREKKRQEEEMNRLRNLEIEGQMKEREKAEERARSRAERLAKLPKLDVNLKDEFDDIEIETTSRDVKKMTTLAQANKMGLETQFGINKVSSMFEEAFDESEILQGGQRGVLYMNCVQENDNMPYTYLIEDYNSEDPPTPYILDELLDELRNPSVFIFEFNGQIFGGYANTEWRLESKEGKYSKENFLFQMNKDHRIRINKHQPDPIFQWKQNDGLGWGATDLILDADGGWMSILGSSYTSNMPLSEEGQKNYLAGVSNFIPDKLEIWVLDYDL